MRRQVRERSSRARTRWRGLRRMLERATWSECGLAGRNIRERDVFAVVGTAVVDATATSDKVAALRLRRSISERDFLVGRIEGGSADRSRSLVRGTGRVHLGIVPAAAKVVVVGVVVDVQAARPRRRCLVERFRDLLTRRDSRVSGKAGCGRGQSARLTSTRATSLALL